MSPASPIERSADRVVVGGGLAGLLAARRAVARGERTVLVEAGARLGGQIAALELGDVLVDSGAESFSTAGPAVLRLIAELGIDAAVERPAPGSASIRGKDERWQIPGGALGIPANLADPAVTAVLSPAELAEARERDAAPWREYASLAELVRERLGAAVLERFVDPVVRGVHGADPARIDPRTLLPDVLARAAETGSLVAGVSAARASAAVPGTPVASLRGGLHALVHALEHELRLAGVELCLGVPAERLEPSPSGWRLQLADGSGVSAARVSLALPAGAAAELVPHAASLRELAGRVHATDSHLLLLRLRSIELDAFPLGPGVLVRADAGLTVKASTHVNAKWPWLAAALPPHEHVVRLSLSAAPPAEPAAQRSLALNALEALYGVHDAELLELAAVRWPAGLSVLDAEGRAAAEQARRASAARGIELVGASVAGNGLLALAKEHFSLLDDSERTRS